MGKILLTKTASKYLGRLDQKTVIRITTAIKGLLGTPMQGDIETVKGTNKMRLRVGGYRIIFRLDPEDGIINILDIGPRGDIYK